MAKKEKPTDDQQPVSKFQAVKSFFEQHPAASNDEALEAVKQQGFDISPRYLAQIKSKTKKPSKAKGAKKKKQPRQARSGEGKAAGGQKAARTALKVDADAVMKAVEFVESMGGVDSANSALQAAAEIIETVRKKHL